MWEGERGSLQSRTGSIALLFGETVELIQTTLTCLLVVLTHVAWMLDRSGVEFKKKIQKITQRATDLSGKLQLLLAKCLPRHDRSIPSHSVSYVI